MVKGIFQTTKTEVICGGEVTKGKLTVPALVRVVRYKNTVAEVEATLLKTAIAPAAAAQAVRFLLENPSITGEIVHIDGGIRLKNTPAMSRVSAA